MVQVKKKTPKTKKKVISKKKKRRLKIIKWTSLLVLLLGAITLFLLSDLFNIKEIIVVNNSKITALEIKELSELQVNENMFKFMEMNVTKKIKQNPYIESVDIHRKLNGTIEIEVTERVATYMLVLEEQYAYINNQGYILEITGEVLEVPTITGYTTENIEPGNRLEQKDLEKLNTVIQIMKVAKEKELDSKITNINIEDENDFKLTMESENKIIHLGNSNKINDKFIMLKAVLEDTVDEKGEIFVKDLNKVFFRENVREEGV